MIGTHWPKLWMVETLLLMLRGSETERTQYAPAGTLMVVDVCSAGVVPGADELVSRKTEVVGEPMVENWSCVVPFTV